jgi:hypothetical protein
MIAWFFLQLQFQRKIYGLQSIYEISHTNNQFSGNVVALHETSGDFHCSEPGIL